jgi:hypothetical protein
MEAKKKPAVRAKKEKKPIQVVAVVTPDGIEGTFTPEPKKPLVVHLPFSSYEVELNVNSNIQYDPNPPAQPEPYIDSSRQYFQVNTDESSAENQIGVEQEGWKMDLEKKEKKEQAEEKKVVSTTTSSAPVPRYQNVKLLACYATKPNETFQTPAKTDVACFWCSHCFEGSPAFLPVKEESGIFHIYGNFCTPQCGLAYLLQEHLDSHVRWERMSLLHRMYKAEGRLYPAPPRESLKKFGGVYSYEEFLKIVSEKTSRIDIQTPPLVSILSTLDTKPVDFYDSSLQNTFSSGFSLDRFKSWSEQGGALRLKRSKPLKDRESTLDAYIQLSVKKRGNEPTVILN